VPDQRKLTSRRALRLSGARNVGAVVSGVVRVWEAITLEGFITACIDLVGQSWGVRSQSWRQECHEWKSVEVQGYEKLLTTSSTQPVTSQLREGKMTQNPSPCLLVTLVPDTHTAGGSILMKVTIKRGLERWWKTSFESKGCFNTAFVLLGDLFITCTSLEYICKKYTRSLKTLPIFIFFNSSSLACPSPSYLSPKQNILNSVHLDSLAIPPAHQSGAHVLGTKSSPGTAIPADSHRCLLTPCRR
jgi:hypothetical protein